MAAGPNKGASKRPAPAPAPAPPPCDDRSRPSSVLPLSGSSPVQGVRPPLACRLSRREPAALGRPRPVRLLFFPSLLWPPCAADPPVVVVHVARVRAAPFPFALASCRSRHPPCDVTAADSQRAGRPGNNRAGRRPDTDPASSRREQVRGGGE
ncbi:hypothetical protein CDD83_5246 [Cordyceps sp. RAO-2017]|nr:hypothetical protein CDD83_5246 [Cordyceps sp. RAO-2017]